MTNAPPITLPRPVRNQRIFTMTPLADALFQVLVFFMLNADPGSYGAINLSRAALSEPGGQAASGPTRTVAVAETVVWTVGSGEVVANGKTFGFDQLSKLGRAVARQGTAHVLLISGKDTLVQDMVNVMQQLWASGVDSVQIAQTGEVD